MRVKEKLIIPSGVGPHTISCAKKITRKAQRTIGVGVWGIDEAGRPRRRASPRHCGYIIGIDEAGRGPLAGPVVVAGVKMRLGRLSPNFFACLRDSKKLSAKQREAWFREIVNSKNLEWAIAKVWSKVIDRINIAQSANLGAWRVYKKLSFPQKNHVRAAPRGRASYARQAVRNRASLAQVKFVRGALPFAMLDGSLYLPPIIPQKTIIKGDEKIKLIAAASVIAKVSRDKTMMRLHKKYPHYRFDIHKGYGTKSHKALLKEFGPSPIHRKSFRLT